jgi:U4/U6 small nuclear ribonucleoprotein PRP3
VLTIKAIRAQIAAKKAQLEAMNRGSASPSPAPSAGPSSTTSAIANDVQARLAAIKAGMAARNSNASASSSASPNPYLPGQNKATPPPNPITSVQLHPLLMGGKVEEKDEKKRNRDRYKPMAPKFASVKANASPASMAAPTPRPVPVAAVALNPYASNGAVAGASSSAPKPEAEGKIVADKRRRRLGGNAQGKYIAQGDELRQEAKLDELRKKIAEAARKAGLDSEFDVLERNLRRQAPPEVDVQHPIQLPAPMEARKPEERGLMLTSKEQKKMRKQRRQAELQDKRDRQKMGLIPADPPKGTSQLLVRASLILLSETRQHDEGPYFRCRPRSYQGRSQDPKRSRRACPEARGGQCES